MNIKQSNLLLLATEYSARLNNFLDDDVLAFTIRQAQSILNDEMDDKPVEEINQRSYELIHEMIACVDYKKSDSKILKKYANDFALTLPYSHHEYFKNGDAMELLNMTHASVKHTKECARYSQDISIEVEGRTCRECKGKDYTIDCPKCNNAISSFLPECPICKIQFNLI